jgi:ribonuclease HI
MNVKIYTDGGCSGNPGPGGWAYIIVGDEKILVEQYGAEKFTTNNRMELSAVINALEALSGLGIPVETLEVFTDSQYVQKGMSSWIYLWKQNEWTTSDRKPVKNKDLWHQLDVVSACPLIEIKWTWVKGHAGNVFNERCDQMTRKAARSITEPSAAKKSIQLLFTFIIYSSFYNCSK